LQGVLTMAERAEKIDSGESSGKLGSVASMRGRQFASGEAIPLGESSGQPSGPKLLVRSSTERSAAAFRGAKARAISLYSAVTKTSSKVTTNIRRGMSQRKDEHPLQFLAVMAGSAFVLGVFLRAWRSRTHE
jgi:hypothetical protein